MRSQGARVADERIVAVPVVYFAGVATGHVLRETVEGVVAEFFVVAGGADPAGAGGGVGDYADGVVGEVDSFVGGVWLLWGGGGFVAGSAGEEVGCSWVVAGEVAVEGLEARVGGVVACLAGKAGPGEGIVLVEVDLDGLAVGGSIVVMGWW